MCPTSSRATSALHGTILARIGAHRIVYPEVASGQAAAQSSTLAALLGLGFRFLDQTALDQLVEGLMSTAIGLQLLNQSYQEGEISAMRRSILISLRAGFGDLPGSVSAELEGIDTLPRLVTLLERASTAPSLEVFLDALKEEQER